LTSEQRVEYEELIKEMAAKNNEALNSAQAMTFTSLAHVAQGASVLAGITDSTSKDASSSKSLDIEGKESTVELMRVSVYAALTKCVTLYT
jgi:hypothetical protein